MGEAKRRKSAMEAGNPWPKDDPENGQINLCTLPSHPSIDSTRIRELTADINIPEGKQVSLKTYRAQIGGRDFFVGFCIGDGERFSAIGLAVIERLLIEAPNEPLHVVPISERDIAWDIVLRHLRTFTGRVLLFTFPNSYVYDGAAAEVYYSEDIVLHDAEGQRVGRLSQEQRREVMRKAAEMGVAPPPPTFYEMPGVDPQEKPWIFGMVASNGKRMRLTVWNGRRDFIHEFPTDIVRLVGGQRIGVVQVGSPVGVNGRSSIALSDHFADQFDGVVHWARDTATYQSIIREFVSANLPSVSPPDLPSDWEPEIALMPVNDGG
jgi:hypothetical protein